MKKAFLRQAIVPYSIFLLGTDFVNETLQLSKLQRCIETFDLLESQPGLLEKIDFECNADLELIQLRRVQNTVLIGITQFEYSSKSSCARRLETL